jgi:hypothetical protein
MGNNMVNYSFDYLTEMRKKRENKTSMNGSNNEKFNFEEYYSRILNKKSSKNYEKLKFELD